MKRILFIYPVEGRIRTLLEELTYSQFNVLLPLYLEEQFSGEHVNKPEDLLYESGASHTGDSLDTRLMTLVRAIWLSQGHLVTFRVICTNVALEGEDLYIELESVYG